MNKENKKNTIKDLYEGIKEIEEEINKVENASDLQPILMFLLKLMFDRKGVAGVKESIEESSQKAQKHDNMPLIDVLLRKLSTYSNFLANFQHKMSKEQSIEMTELIAEALIDVKVHIQTK